MTTYTNTQNIPLALAVFLASDSYDYEADTISATSLIKPTRQLILSQKVNPKDSLTDISALIKASIGNAIHSAVEDAWKTNYKTALQSLGYNDKLIDRVLINPTSEDLAIKDKSLTVHLEQRLYKNFLGYKISGKFDLLLDGELNDIKSTGVYTYTHNTKAEDYILQGSIYRWLNPDLITSEYININFIFLDWKAYELKSQPNYPSQPVLSTKYSLMSLKDTEDYIRAKLNELTLLKDSDQSELPKCTDSQLWRKPAVWKYYSNPQKMTRSTKNFPDKLSAYMYLTEKNNKGIVIEKPGEVVACKFCSAFPICTQKDELIAEGSLIL